MMTQMTIRKVMTAMILRVLTTNSTSPKTRTGAMWMHMLMMMKMVIHRGVHRVSSFQ